MIRKIRLISIAAFCVFAVSLVKAGAPIPAPEDVLGFKPGADRKLASWQMIVAYFKRLDAASDRVKFAELGKTTLGAPFVVAFISSAENLRHLDDYKRIQAQLADPRLLGSDSDAKAAQLIARGKTVVLITCGIHSTEVGSTLSSMLIAHMLAASDNAKIRAILEQTIVVLVPSLNPDGVDIVKNWYDQTLGTPFEGSEPPVLYHNFTGHDNNRDWYAFTQVETQLTVDKLHNVWHPQIVHDIHQQGQFNARLFLPPYMQPVEPNVPKQLVEGYTELGHYIATEMRAAGFSGITTDSTYDAWTPARAYSHYHGGVRMLSETASCKLATPITIQFNQLRPEEGYDPRKLSVSFGPLWQGGEWHLRDITNYMTTAAITLLGHAANHREEWLRRFYEVGKQAVRPRQEGELLGLRLDYVANTPQILRILDRAGVKYGSAVDEVNTTTAAPAAAHVHDGILIPMQQPYAAFARALLQRQEYPNLRDGEGNPIEPYDVTAHDLSLLMRVPVTPVFSQSGMGMKHIDSATRADADCSSVPITPIAIYRSYVPALDEGWTRWALGRCYPYEPLFNQDIRRGAFAVKHAATAKAGAEYRTIVIPDQSASVILNGHASGTMPDNYVGGIDAEGVVKLRHFVDQGGTLVCLNRAADFAIEAFNLPLRDSVSGLDKKQFFVPGSILRIQLDTNHALARDLATESIVWFENSPAFEITDKSRASEVTVVAKYPDDGELLMSGWLLGSERLRGKAALVDVRYGNGHIILFGFRPQYRGQSLATYPLFVRALTEAL